MRRAPGSMSSDSVTGTLTYWAMACTPASVRPAHVSSQGRRSVGATQLASDGALRRLLRKAAEALTAVAKLDDQGTRRLGTSLVDACGFCALLVHVHSFSGYRKGPGTWPGPLRRT